MDVMSLSHCSRVTQGEADAGYHDIKPASKQQQHRNPDLIVKTRLTSGAGWRDQKDGSDKEPPLEGPVLQEA